MLQQLSGLTHVVERLRENIKNACEVTGGGGEKKESSCILRGPHVLVNLARHVSYNYGTSPQTAFASPRFAEPLWKNRRCCSPARRQNKLAQRSLIITCERTQNFMVLLHAKQPIESADEPAVHRRDYGGKWVGAGGWEVGSEGDGGSEMEIDHHLLTVDMYSCIVDVCYPPLPAPLLLHRVLRIEFQII